ncbi:hypothetical protein ACLB2K_047030 [Fragaria x ananassa]
MVSDLLPLQQATLVKNRRCPRQTKTSIAFNHSLRLKGLEDLLLPENDLHWTKHGRAQSMLPSTPLSRLKGWNQDPESHPSAARNPSPGSNPP